MKILVVANFSTPFCGFRHYADQMLVTFRRAGLDVTPWDGAWDAMQARRAAGLTDWWPPDVQTYDVVHFIWHPAPMNHYSGADYPPGPLYSFFNGNTFAGCPFLHNFPLKWSAIPIPDHHLNFYPVVDWIDDLPEPDAEFTIGLTGVRKEGFEEVIAVAEAHGWKLNLSTTGVWLPLEEEIKRLARSTVNVCWYGPEHLDRSGGVMTALAARRPMLVSRVPMFDHLANAEGFYPDDLYHSDHEEGELEWHLRWIETEWKADRLRMPFATLDRFSWTRSTEIFRSVWEEALR